LSRLPYTLYCKGLRGKTTPEGLLGVSDNTKFAFEAGRPKYQQVADDLRRRIREGELPIGVSLGDIFLMGEHYGCSWGTVREAQRRLVAEGLLSEIRPGLPTRVIAVPSEPVPDPLLTRLYKLRLDLDEIIADLESTSDDLVSRQIAALKKFDLPDGEGLSRAEASQVFKEYGLNPRSFGAWIQSGYIERVGDSRFLTSKGRAWIQGNSPSKAPA
jgi:DNA-binding transcriptional regulator YhcF (GntR family)